MGETCLCEIDPLLNQETLIREGIHLRKFGISTVEIRLGIGLVDRAHLLTEVDEKGHLFGTHLCKAGTNNQYPIAVLSRQSHASGLGHSEHRSVLSEHTKLTEYTRCLDLIRSTRKHDL